MREGLLRGAGVSRKDFLTPKKIHAEDVVSLCPVDRVMSGCDDAQRCCSHPDVHLGNEPKLEALQS